ncbi:MAG: RagB/SusD family nutrient uptake outer membrane protein [Balneolaceae bacterium]
MINKTITTTLAFAVLLFAGCDGLLDTKPTDAIDAETATATPENLDAVLLSTYDSISDDDLFGGEIQMDADLLATDVNAPEITFTGTFGYLQEIASQSIRVSNGQAFATWAEGYYGINQANIVLANIETYDAADRDAKAAEALFVRGTIYFELAKAYGLPYSAGNTTTNLAVPIVLEPDNFELVSRATVEAVYDQAEADLIAARDGLSTSNGVLATSHVANAMLSRLYLQKGEFQAAATAANAVIQSGDFTLTADFADAFNNATNSSEDIFALQVSETDGAQSLNTFYGSSGAGGRGDISINAAHTNLYEIGDARGAFFYNDTDGDPSTPLRTTKWQNQYGNIPVVRLAEMYLTRAEANFKSGVAQVGPNTPLADVNVVRDRANLLPLLTVDEAAILLERKLELAFEGQLLHDLKRTQRSIGTFAYNSGELIFPIPQAERDVNPNLEQNSAYTAN